MLPWPESNRIVHVSRQFMLIFIFGLKSDSIALFI